MRKSLGRSSLNLDELQTVIIEIENVLNSIPLTYLYTDEMDEALTPSHLICGRRLLTLTSEFDTSAKIINSEEQENTTNSLKRRTKYLSSLLDHYWKKWRIDYSTNIRELHRSSSKTQKGIMNLIIKGDIVVVENDLPRTLWS